MARFKFNQRKCHVYANKQFKAELLRSWDSSIAPVLVTERGCVIRVATTRRRTAHSLQVPTRVRSKRGGYYRKHNLHASGSTGQRPKDHKRRIELQRRPAPSGNWYHSSRSTLRPSVVSRRLRWRNAAHRWITLAVRKMNSVGCSTTCSLRWYFRRRIVGSG